MPTRSSTAQLNGKPLPIYPPVKQTQHYVAELSKHAQSDLCCCRLPYGSPVSGPPKLDTANDDRRTNARCWFHYL